MTKQTLLLLFIGVCTIWNSAKAQTYTIESSEGVKVKIHLNEPSWYIATVSCLTDTVFLNDYRGVKEVRVLKRKFLKIVYDTRGGSGFQSRNTVILSVNKKKINVSMLVTSFGKAFGGDIDGSLYSVKFGMTGNDKSNFKLIAHIYDRHNSIRHPEKSYIKNKQAILDFDPNQNIFYSSHKKTAQLFKIDVADVQSENLELNETFPVIILNGDSYCYYYIKGKWYKGDDNTLFEEYHNNHL
ncbi:MAG TPA: hypothetical protein VK668_12655 [Mucilaginibacter sp.]|nr:hypothetical protein [Mucilaginibacter sp.]